MLSAREARERRSNKGYLPITLCIDAKPVYAAVTATFVKRPADQSLLCDAQYLRELLDMQVLRQISWIDTRDMYADGLTNGAVHRSAVRAIMSGSIVPKAHCVLR